MQIRRRVLLLNWVFFLLRFKIKPAIVGTELASLVVLVSQKDNKSDLCGPLTKKARDFREDFRGNNARAFGLN